MTNGQRDDGFGLQHVERVPLPLQPGSRVYVEGKSRLTAPYGLQFTVEQVNSDSVLIAYGAWIDGSDYRSVSVSAAITTRPAFHSRARLISKRLSDHTLPLRWSMESRCSYWLGLCRLRDHWRDTT